MLIKYRPLRQVYKYSTEFRNALLFRFFFAPIIILRLRLIAVGQMFIVTSVLTFLSF